MRRVGRGEARQRVPGAKVVVPDIPSGYVSRPRLLSAVDQAQDATVIVVSASAGSGKTLLLAEWVRLRHPDATAWVSLDSDDSDDRRFWSGILKALEQCPAVPAANPIRRLGVPANPSRNAGFTGAVINALDGLPRPVWLVLDDLHEVEAAGPLEGLETLLRQHPAALRLVLVTRHDPPLSLAKLRLADQLGEIRADDLRFSGDEAHALLAAAGVELSPDQVAELVRRTEGWAAGLRLATVSLRDAEDRERFLADFAENDRAVADYLLDEVLSRLPAELLEFLRAISVSDEVSPELARTLSGRADVGVMLDALEATSLVMRVGARRRRYRVHALVRSYLLAGLNRQLPGRAALLHRHAAEWFADHGSPAQALAQLIQTRDADRVVGSLRQLALPLALSGEHDLLARALAILGDTVIAADSSLALVSALLHLEQGDAAGADVDLAHAEAAWVVPAPAELEQLRLLVKARVAELTGDVDDMVRNTGPLEPGDAGHTLDAMRMLQRGTALLAADRQGAAQNELAAALDVARENGQDYVAIQCLAVLAGAAGNEGDYRLMGRLAGEALREAEDKGRQHTMAAATASAMLAYRALLLGRPAECLRHTDDAARLVEGSAPPANLGLSVLLGTLGGTARFDSGEWTEGLGQLGAVRAAARGSHLSAGEVALGAMLEHRAAVRFGWTRAAREAVAWIRAAVPESGELMLMRARTQFAMGRPASAGALIRPLLDDSHTVVLPWTVVDAWLLSAELAHLDDDGSGAQRALRKALSLAEDMDVLYPLVFASPVVADLLVSRLGKLGSLHTVAARVLEGRQTLRAPLPPAPLTRRERAVLGLLPTLRSFDEIAQDLTISPNTVKTHVRSIYHKLGVRKRRDAVVVAQEHGLLERVSEVTNGPGLH